MQEIFTSDISGCVSALVTGTFDVAELSSAYFLKEVLSDRVLALTFGR